MGSKSAFGSPVEESQSDESSRHALSTMNWVGSPSTEALSGSPVEQNLPFCFGCEFEVMIKPKAIIGISIPPADASVSLKRRFNFSLLSVIQKILNEAGLESNVFDPSGGNSPNYTVWNVMLDGSLSKSHICDGFCKN